MQERLSSIQTIEGARRLANENQSPCLHKVWKTLNKVTVGSIWPEGTMKKEFGHHKSQTSDDKYQWYRPEARTSQNPLRVAEGGDHASPPEHPKGKSGLDASAKVTRAELNKRSRDADLSKDKSGSESPLEFQRS
ncbi:hypothetical protein Tco_0520024, partial [Tanacetum coccineum]